MKANQDSTAGEDNSSVSDNLSSDALIRQLTEGNIQEVEADTETEEVSEEEPEQEFEETLCPKTLEAKWMQTQIMPGSPTMVPFEEQIGAEKAAVIAQTLEVAMI